MSKRITAILIGVAVLVIAGIVLVRSNQAAQSSQELQTEAAQVADLRVTADATGVVRAGQSALLIWQTSGEVAGVQARLGQAVTAGQALAELKTGSLPQQVILAQSDLIAARKALEDLQNSQLQSAQAQQAVDQARRALEDAQNPAASQAAAQQAVADAQKGVDEAKRTLAVLQSPVPAAALEQSRTSLRMAENVLNRTRENVARIERRLAKPERQYFFFENRPFYRKILRNLQIKQAGDQRAYENALQRYNALLEPVDPQDLALAQANVAGNLAQLAQAQRDWERLKDGASPADLAVLETRLADAQRTWERLKDGPDPQDLLAAQARIDAAQALLNQAHITAPFDGVITRAPLKPGDRVTPGTLAFRLDHLAELLVEMQVSEIDINRVAVGQPVLITFDSARDRAYQAEVAQVAQVSTPAGGVVSFTVQARLLDADAFVKPGMTASATIVLAELSQVLQVPNRAIRMLEGQRVVYLLRGGEPTPVAVTLGLASPAYSQVLQGDIQPGDLVVLDPPNP